MTAEQGAGVKPVARRVSLRSAGLSSLVEGVLREGAAVRLRVSGASMLPYLSGGDVLTIAPVGERLPQLGDVAALKRRSDERLVIHRIVEIRNGRYVLKGDSLPGIDGEFGASELLGVVDRVERAGGAPVAPSPLGRRVAATLSRCGATRIAGNAWIAGGAFLATVMRLLTSVRAV